MDTGDTAAVAAVIVGIAAGLIALAALVVSYLAWKESRRSADAAVRSAKASEESAVAAARSAVAEEAAIELARREAEQRDIDREDEAGPTFEPAKGLLREYRDGVWRAEAELRVEGGSDRMNVRVELVADTSFQTLHNGVDEQPRDTLMFNSIVPGGTISVCALPRLPLDGYRRRCCCVLWPPATTTLRGRGHVVCASTFGDGPACACCRLTAGSIREDQHAGAYLLTEETTEDQSRTARPSGPRSTWISGSRILTLASCNRSALGR